MRKKQEEAAALARQKAEEEVVVVAWSFLLKCITDCRGTSTSRRGHSRDKREKSGG